MLNGLDLFSGIGGLSLALERWVLPALYCENDRYAQAVLLSRMSSLDLHRAPIWDDVRTLRIPKGDGIDIIYGGFPCQDISIAGTGRGLSGARSGLFYEALRLCEEIRPRFIFLENVPAIRTRGAAVIAKELAGIGYDFKWDIVSAAEVGAPHLRKRWFLLAHARSEQLRNESGRGSGEDRKNSGEPRNNGAQESMAVAQGDGWREGRPESAREQGRPSAASGSDSMADTPSAGRHSAWAANAAKAQGWRALGGPWGSGWWTTEPAVGRVAHGISNRVDKLRGLGNSVVPIQARIAFERLMGLNADFNAKSDRETE